MARPLPIETTAATAARRGDCLIYLYKIVQSCEAPDLIAFDPSMLRKLAAGPGLSWANPALRRIVNFAVPRPGCLAWRARAAGLYGLDREGIEVTPARCVFLARHLALWLGGECVDWEGVQA